MKKREEYDTNSAEEVMPGITESADEKNEAEETLEEILEQAGLEDSEQPKTSIDPKEAELREAKERIIRLMADFDNFRKRVQREKEEWHQYSSMSFIEKLLPVIDNLERALENIDRHSEEVKGIFSGVAMTYRQLTDILQQEGMTAVEGVGASFDPLIHEAVMQEQAENGQEDNEVVQVLRKGYRFKDKLLRPSMVKVAKK